MKNEFNIIFINSIEAEATKRLFKLAIKEFNRVYTPASFVEITRVEHMRASYDPKKEDFQHSFCVSWQEPSK